LDDLFHLDGSIGELHRTKISTDALHIAFSNVFERCIQPVSNLASVRNATIIANVENNGSDLEAQGGINDVIQLLLKLIGVFLGTEVFSTICKEIQALFTAGKLFFAK